MSDLTDDSLTAASSHEQCSSDVLAEEGGGRGEAPPVSMPIPPDGNHYVTSDSLGHPPDGSHYVMSDSTSHATSLELVPPVSGLVTPAKRRSLAAAKHVEYVQHLDRKLRGQVSKMMLTALRAPEVAAQGAPEGMTKTELRIARDAMISEKDCPVYLRMASRILDGYKRAEVLSERDPAPRLNVETIQVAVSNTYNYEVIEAPEDKR